MLSQVIVIALCFSPFKRRKIELSLGVWEVLTLGLLTTVIGHSLFLYSLSTPSQQQA